MTDPGAGPAPAVLVRSGDTTIARRSRWAGVALVLVLLGVSAFAVWSSQATSRASVQAVSASGLSYDYGQAVVAVTSERSLERKYRVEPGPVVQVQFDQAAVTFAAALDRVRRDGDVGDRAFVDATLAQHDRYLTGVERLFRAVDRGEAAAVATIDAQEVDPSFAVVEQAVQSSAQRTHALALAQLARLQELETRSGELTPLVFLVGLGLAVLLASVSRGYRRQLGVERSQAIHASRHDALTGLPNRTLLAERFGRALGAQTRHGTRTGLMVIDLDRFKEINDTFGHHYGDELLTQVGPRLTGALREVDTVARLGGDEFAVLLPGVGSVEEVLAVAATLRAALETPFGVQGVDLDVEASVGVVLSGEHGTDPTTLLQRADVAMYVAKAQNLGVCAYDPEHDEHSPAKLALLGELRRALERSELVLHYQPKLSIHTGEVVSAEALVRWQHPDRGLVMPDEFISLAEHTGLIGPLTWYVLDTALTQARSWAEAGRPLPVSVNLSARNLLDEHLPDVVAELLALHGVPAERLELEVTETALMTEPARARRLLEELSALGVLISIDDFGAGYTSLGQLRALPVTELKIDKSFVMTMTEDRSNALIVHSVVDLGHNLGLTIVAEGVETEQTLVELRALGCDVAQGYHVSRPLPAEALTTWLQGRPIHSRCARTTPTPGAPARPDRPVPRGAGAPGRPPARTSPVAAPRFPARGMGLGADLRPAQAPRGCGVDSAGPGAQRAPRPGWWRWRPRRRW